MINTKKTYGVAALLSFFFPGLGQIIKGQVARGIVIMIAYWIGIITIIGIIFSIPFWFWQIYDAYNKPANN